MIKLSVQADALYKNLTNTMKGIKDMTPLMLQIRGKSGDQNPYTMIGWINKAFATKGASVGYGWKDLNKKYAEKKNKKYPGNPILVAKGDLFKSYVLFGAGNVNILQKNKISYGTMIPYAWFHESGTTKMPKRPIFTNMQKPLSVWKKMIRDYTKELLEGESKGAKI